MHVLLFLTICQIRTEEPGISAVSDRADNKTVIHVDVKDSYGSSKHVELYKAMSRVQIEKGVIVKIGDREWESSLEWVEPGTVVSIRAREPEEDMRFDCWQVTPASVKLEDDKALETTFTVPEGSVRILAVYGAIASPSNATAVSKADPKDWYAYGHQDSLEELLGDPEIITEEDEERLLKGWNVEVEFNMEKKSASYGGKASEAIREEMEPEERIAFFVKTTLKKNITNRDSSKKQTLNLSTASNAVRMTMEVAEACDNWENYRVIGWNDSEQSVSEYDILWDEKGRIFTVTGEVNGVYGVIYSLAEEIKPDEPDEDDEFDDSDDADDIDEAAQQQAGSEKLWEQDSKGWRYKEKGGYVTSAWRYLNWSGAPGWYYFGSDSYMKSGWFKDLDGNWYYLNPVSDGSQGKMITGWQFINGNWYYLNPVSDKTQGKMVTGWQNIDGKPYYFSEKADETLGALRQTDSESP